MMKMRKLIICATVLGITSLFPLFLQAQTRLPQPPHTPPPNRTRPGGGLDPARLSCNNSDQQVIALVPAENPVLTTSNQPTLLIYIPYSADEVKLGEFSLLTWPQETQRLYKTRFTLPQTPGIVSISLASLPEATLEAGQYYHWYLQIYCHDNTDNQPDLELNGWLQKIPLTPQRETQINNASPEIWYDALAKVAEELRLSPEDPQLQHSWRSLLEVINQQSLSQVPLSGSVILGEEKI